MLKFCTDNHNCYYYDNRTLNVVPADIVPIDIDDVLEDIPMSLNDDWKLELEKRASRVKDMLTYHVPTTLIFEITRACNLRCSYCYLSDSLKRYSNFDNSMLPFDIVTAVLDWVFSSICEGHSRFTTYPYIGFYGGEPLLDFSLISNVVNYTKEKYPSIPVKWNLTTNLTFLTKEMLEFFIDNDFYIMVSLNGDRLSHDMFRVDINGNGTWKKVMDNLLFVKRTYPDYFRNNMGIITRFDENKTDFFRYLEFWETYDAELPKIVSVNKLFWDDPFKGKDMSYSANSWFANRKYFVDMFFSSLLKGERPNVVLAKYLLRYYMPIIERRKNRFLPYTNTCAPGAKLYITLDGNFHICENIPPTFPIGDVNRKVDLPRVYELIATYGKDMFPRCSSCPISHLCNVCYARVLVGERFQRFPSSMCEDKVEEFRKLFSELWSFFENGGSPQSIVNLYESLGGVGDEGI